MKERRDRIDEPIERQREDQPYAIPNEGACSPEFPQGCIISE